MQEGRLSAISADEPVVSDSAVKQLKHRIWELERILGRKTLEIGILKEGVEISRLKNLKKRITQVPLPPPDDSRGRRFTTPWWCPSRT